MTEGYKAENLVVLRFAINRAYAEVVDASDIPDLEIYLDRGTYKYGNYLEVEIGRRIPEVGGGIWNEGIIGVYDRTKTGQLDRMVHDAISCTREP